MRKLIFVSILAMTATAAVMAPTQAASVIIQSDDGNQYLPDEPSDNGVVIVRRHHHSHSYDNQYGDGQYGDDQYGQYGDDEDNNGGEYRRHFRHHRCHIELVKHWRHHHKGDRRGSRLHLTGAFHTHDHGLPQGRGYAALHNFAAMPTMQAWSEPPSPSW